MYQFNDRPFHEYVGVWIAMVAVRAARDSRQSQAGPVNPASCPTLRGHVCLPPRRQHRGR